jgi:hypothetical protein
MLQQKQPGESDKNDWNHWEMASCHWRIATHMHAKGHDKHSDHSTQPNVGDIEARHDHWHHRGSRCSQSQEKQVEDQAKHQDK